VRPVPDPLPAPLRSGVGVCHDIPGLDLGERLSLSSGVEPAVHSRIGVRYAADAFRPRPPWRTPARGEFGLLTDVAERTPATCVGLTRFPEATLAPLCALGLAQLHGRPDVERLLAHPDYPAAQAALERHVRRFCAAGSELVWHPLNCSPHDLDTVTCDQRPAVLVGLHVDNWDALDPEPPATGRNRICLNAGLEARYFLFVNLTVGQVRAMAPEAPASANRLADLHGAVTGFLRRHPHYPVIRLRVEPGEAYIAPTENIVHDGSTAGSRALDLALVVRGHFGLSAGASC
jgi:hypothetical protein